MIDIIKVQKVFDEYVNNYDMTNDKITLKYCHTKRVADICREMAISLKLDNEHILLATLIGYLHDIGRFEQIKEYDSYNDKKTIDHAELGTQMLFNNNFIREFVEISKYDEIIKKSVLVHNKLAIPEYLTDEEKLYAKIVRDADKIDILYLMLINEIKFDINNETLSKEIKESIINEISIDRSFVKNNIDKVALNLAFVYDLNFSYSFEFLKSKNYIPTIIESLVLNNEDKLIFNKIVEYIDKKIFEYKE